MYRHLVHVLMDTMPLYAVLTTLSQVLTSLLEKSLSPNLASLYGGHLTSLLMLAQAKLLTAMASCHQGVPQQSFLRYCRCMGGSIEFTLIVHANVINPVDIQPLHHHHPQTMHQVGSWLFYAVAIYMYLSFLSFCYQ